MLISPDSMCPDTIPLVILVTCCTPYCRQADKMVSRLTKFTGCVQEKADKSGAMAKEIPIGLFTYPVLQAADVLIYKYFMYFDT